MDNSIKNLLLFVAVFAIFWVVDYFDSHYIYRKCEEDGQAKIGWSEKVIDCKPAIKPIKEKL